MERKKLKPKKKTKTKYLGFLSSCLLCIKPIKEDEESYVIKNDENPLPTPNVTTKQEVSVTYQSTSSYYVSKPELTTKLILADSQHEQESPVAPFDPKFLIQRQYKDHLIRAILNKYLESKKESDGTAAEKKNEKQVKPESPRQQNPDFVKVECYSSDSVETVVLGNTEKELLRPSLDFPTKSKSAPTTSTAHDSLADICCKMSRFKQENKSSDSYITCCSEENTTNVMNADIRTSKKKLELIFNQSSEDITSGLEDNSAGPLQYEITCEGSPAAVGSLRPDSIPARSERSYGPKNGTGFTSQALYLHPKAVGEMGVATRSSASLKWKLIISHHDHGDFP